MHHGVEASRPENVIDALLVAGIRLHKLCLRWDRHHPAHLEFVKTLEAIGLEMLVAPEHRIWNLNTPKVPQGVDDAKVRTTLLKEHGIEIAGGFGPLAGKIFRIGLMGPLATTEYVRDFSDCFAAALRGAGYKH